MWKIAQFQVDIYASAENLKVVGYYQANQNPDDRTPSLVGKTIASLIESKTGAGALYIVVRILGTRWTRSFTCGRAHASASLETNQVDMSKLNTSDPPLLGYTKEGNGWQLVKSKLSIQTPPTSILANASFQHLHDFDEHLESLQMDWLKNSKVATLIDAR